MLDIIFLNYLDLLALLGQPQLREAFLEQLRQKYAIRIPVEDGENLSSNHSHPIEVRRLPTGSAVFDKQERDGKVAQATRI